MPIHQTKSIIIYLLHCKLPKQNWISLLSGPALINIAFMRKCSHTKSVIIYVILYFVLTHKDVQKYKHVSDHACAQLPVVEIERCT